MALLRVALTTFDKQCSNFDFQFHLEDDFSDLVLICANQSDGSTAMIRTHKLLMLMSSGYIRETLLKMNPAPTLSIFLDCIYFENLEPILDFIYNDYVDIPEDHLETFVQDAQLLKVFALCEEKTEQMDEMTHVEQGFSVELFKRDDLSNVDCFGNEDKAEILRFVSHHEFIDRVDEPTLISTKNKSPEDGIFKIESVICGQSPEKAYSEDQPGDEDGGSERDRYHDIKDEPEEQPQPEVDTMNEQKKVFTCPECSKSYQSVAALRLHSKVHDGKTTCPLCAKVLSRSYSLKVHMAKVHKMEPDINQIKPME